MLKLKRSCELTALHLGVGAPGYSWVYLEHSSPPVLL